MKTGFKKLTVVLFLAILFAAGNLNAKGNEVYASSHEETEETMELENWMVNEYYWSDSETILIEETKDANLELESWMTDENNWKTEIFAEIENDSDSNLTLKNWMINENIWMK